jgi:signal transduction histidine kinase
VKVTQIAFPDRRRNAPPQHIVRDLLDLARDESGAGAFGPRVFAIARVFESVVRRHEREAAERRIEMRMWVSRTADQMFSDPDRLEQVIENLVATALRHTPEMGTIDLQATAARTDGRFRSSNPASSRCSRSSSRMGNSSSTTSARDRGVSAGMQVCRSQALAAAGS